MSIADHAAVTLDALASEMSGELVRPEDETFDEARSVWNGMIDLRPAGVARCARQPTSGGDRGRAVSRTSARRARRRT